MVKKHTFQIIDGEAIVAQLGDIEITSLATIALQLAGTLVAEQMVDKAVANGEFEAVPEINEFKEMCFEELKRAFLDCHHKGLTNRPSIVSSTVH